MWYVVAVACATVYAVVVGHAPPILPRTAGLLDAGVRAFAFAAETVGETVGYGEESLGVHEEEKGVEENEFEIHDLNINIITIKG